MSENRLRESIIASGSRLLAKRPFETVTSRDIAAAASISESDFSKCFSSMHDLGAAILTYEGSSMRAAQKKATAMADTPLDRLILAFRFVGENLAVDSTVRAGIRIAGESHHCFPERQIDPFRTWQSFILAVLAEADAHGSLRKGSDYEGTAWLLTAAGLGTKDLLMFTEAWHDAPQLLEQCARLTISTIIQ